MPQKSNRGRILGPIQVCQIEGQRIECTKFSLNIAKKRLMQKSGNKSGLFTFKQS